MTKIRSMNAVSNILRNATQDEVNFYFQKLYPLQDMVLESIRSQAFYLTGGTALSRFYFHHRFSDDLDFFYNGFDHPKEDFHFIYRDIVSRLEKFFDKIEIAIDGEYFKRLFVNKNNIPLKLEFIYENFKTVGVKKEFKGTLIDAKENICANKIGAVSDRRTARDFFDLYFLLKEFELTQAIQWSELKRVPPDYEGMMIATGELLKNPEILEGELLLLQPFDDEKFKIFIKQLIGDLLSYAKTRHDSI